MSATTDSNGDTDSAQRFQRESLPEDVRGWLAQALGQDEPVYVCVFGDIDQSGAFAERWTFLTDRRVLVLSPNARPDGADVVFDMPVDDIQEIQVRDYVSSGALVATSADKSHEVMRFSLTSRHEASDLCRCFEELSRQRKEMDAGGVVTAPSLSKRPSHRCPNCGRALRRVGEVCRHCMDQRRLIVRLLSYLGPYKGYAVGGLALTILLTGLQLVPPYLTKVLVDDVIQPRDARLLPWIIGLLVAVYIGRALVAGVRRYVMQWLGNRVLFDMRVEVFDHLQMLRLSYYNQKQTGQIMSRVTGDLQRLQHFVSEGFQEILVNLMTMLMITAILLTLNWKLFLLALAPIPIITISTLIFGRRVHLLYHRLWRRMGTVSAVLADTIPGIRVVKSFAQEHRESRRFAKRSADLLEQQLGVTKLASSFFPFLGLMTGMGSVLIFGVGGYMVLGGATSLGVLIAFTGYLWQFYAPVQRFGDMNHRLQHCSTSAERVFEILDTDVEPLQQAGGVQLTPLRGKVEFQDVSFSYEPGKFALDGISFVVEPGEMIGLVGPSGAGKSTLVHLIARLYDVERGRILIDGHDIQDLDLRTYRQQTGVVLQEPYLFHGSIWANIAYANADASADEIITAARAANAHEFIINMPDGYDTIVGERGQTLSGGERQRISIARAILRDPRILILDEATASVDLETEVKIQTALERLVKNRTTFAIAHRLSTLRKADRLVVLERSKLAEIGTHEELVEAGGLFSRLCNLQSELSKTRAW